MKTLGTNLLSSTGEQYGLKPTLLVELLIGSGYKYYSSDDVTGYKTGITNFSGFQNEAKFQHVGCVGTVTVSIVDKDQSLYAEIQSGKFYNREARVGLYYAGLSGSGQSLYQGRISAPVKYDEYKQEATFSIRTNIRSQEVGFSVESNTFSINNDVVIGKVWPRVYGKVAHVPALLAQRQPYGELRSPISFGLKTAQMWNDTTRFLNATNSDHPDIELTDSSTISSYGVTAGDTVDIRDNEIWIDGSERFPFDEEIQLNIDGVIFKGSFTTGNGDIFTVSEANVPKYTDLEIASRDNDDSSNKNNPLVLWISDPSKSLINNYITFTKPNDKIAFLYETQRVVRKVVYQQNDKIWLDKPVEDENFKPILLGPSNTLSEIRTLPLNCTFESIDQFVEELRGILIHKGVPTKDTTNSPYGALIEQLDILKFATGFFWSKGEGTFVRQWGANPDIYVANSVESNDVLSVYGVRTYDGVDTFAPIPKGYYTVVLDRDTTIAEGQGPQTVTTIEFLEPLKSMKDQGWKDDVYVSVDSTLPSNPASICQQLLSASGIDIDLGSSVADLAGYPCNFLLDKKSDSIELAEKIAWQSRSVILYDDLYGAKFKYIGSTPNSVKTITESDIIYGSFVSGESDESTLVTSFEGDYLRSYKPQVNNDRDESRLVLKQQNSNGFGQYRQQYDFFCHTQNQCVDHSCAFWGNRYANIWRKCSFSLTHKFIDLEPFDRVEVSINIAYFGISIFTGIVENITTNPTTGSLDVVLLTPYKQGSLIADPNFWLADTSSSPDNYADTLSEVNYNVQVPKDRKTVDDALRELQDYQKNVKFSGKIVSINVDGYSDKVTFDAYAGGLDADPTQTGLTGFLTDQTSQYSVGDVVDVTQGGKNQYHLKQSTTEFHAKITGEPESGKYSWKLLKFDPANAGEFLDFSPAITGTSNAFELNGTTGIPNDTIVKMRGASVDSSGNPIFSFSYGGGSVIQVTLSQDGGSDGTQSSAPTYTYSAFDSNSNLLGSGLVPWVGAGHQSYGSWVPASRGTGFYDSDGYFKLLSTNEMPYALGC